MGRLDPSPQKPQCSTREIELSRVEQDSMLVPADVSALASKAGCVDAERINSHKDRNALNIFWGVTATSSIRDNWTGASWFRR